MSVHLIIQQIELSFISNHSVYVCVPEAWVKNVQSVHRSLCNRPKLVTTQMSIHSKKCECHRELVKSWAGETLRDCVLFDVSWPCQGSRNRAHGNLAKSFSTRVRLGIGKAFFLWSKYECFLMTDQCVQKLASVSLSFPQMPETAYLQRPPTETSFKKCGGSQLQQ